MDAKQTLLGIALVASLGGNATLIAINQPKADRLIPGAVVEQRVDAVRVPAHALIDADTIVADIPEQIQRSPVKFNPMNVLPSGTVLDIEVKRNDSTWYAYHIDITDSLYPTDGQVLRFVMKYQLVPGMPEAVRDTSAKPAPAPEPVGEVIP